MNVNFFNIVGKLGVVLFFVLSGFLITSLLLNENDSTGSINLKTFYQRRVLRIWPLYFLMLGIGFFILPNFHYWEIPNEMFVSVHDDFLLKLSLYVVILPNLAVVLFREIVGVSQAWSLGTEEQFYLIWPLIIKKFRKRLLPTMVVILVFYWVVKLLSSLLINFSDFWLVLNKFWSLFNINCMAIGGVFAVISHDNHYKFLKILFNKYFFLGVCASLIIFLALGVKVPFFHFEFYSILFGVVILNLACNPIYEKVFKNKIINYLGSISYGLYMYHPMILPIGILIGQFYDCMILIYVFTILCTILISVLSFEYFEKYFLQIKNRLS